MDGEKDNEKTVFLGGGITIRKIAILSVNLVEYD